MYQLSRLYFFRILIGAVLLAAPLSLNGPAAAAGARGSFSTTSLNPFDLFSLDLELDNTDAYASAPDVSPLDLGTGAGDDFTIESFFYVPDLTNATTDTLIWKNGAYGLYIIYYTAQPDRFIFRINTGPTSYVYIFYNVELNVGWHHAAAVFDNEYTDTQDLMALYVDGNLSASGTAVEWTPGIMNSASALNVGGYSGLNAAHGWIEETRLSSLVRYSGETYTVPTAPFTADSDTRGLWHFDEDWGTSTFADSSGNGNTLSGQNGAQVGSPQGVIPPSMFGKSAPADGAAGLPGSLMLSWEASSGATGYEYCYDSSDNDTCDDVWNPNEANTSAGLSSLSNDTTYYWQVQASNAGGPTDADNGDWWSFTTEGISPGTIFVDHAAIGVEDGTSWQDAFTDLQDALAIAIPGDEIWVAAGIYKPTSDENRGFSFVLKNGVSIYGGFAGGEDAVGQRDWVANETILSGDLNGDDEGFTNNSENSYHIVSGGGTDNSAVLDGFTITAGNASDLYSPDSNGGGMYNFESSPTLINLSFSNNAAYYGGGGMHNNGSSPALTNVIFSGNTASISGGGMENVWGSSPMLIDVTFSGNQAGSGGGMMNGNGSNPALTNVTFSGNSAQGGGGMRNTRSNPELMNVTFNGNAAGWAGGGMLNSESNPTLIDVAFSNNTADEGGGIYNMMNSVPTLTNVTFTGNTASTWGGGMLNGTGNSILTNVTFSSNSASEGGGMYNSSSSPILTNVTFSSNTATAHGGGMYNNYSSPILTNATFSGNTSFYGGGMENYNSNPTLTNVTFRGNSAFDTGGIFNSGSSPTLTNVILWGDGVEVAGSSAFITDSVVQGGCPGGSPEGYCTNIITDDPVLGLLADNGGFTQTMALGAGSSAIDAGGVNSTCADTDQRGMARPQGAACDIGAYEAILYTLTVIKEGSGSGTVTSNQGGLDCGSDCSQDYPSDTPVILSAIADADSVFIGWGDDCNVNGAVMMEADKSCTATFDLEPTTTHTVADFDGDGDTDISYFRPSTGRWYVLGQPSVAFGASGDIPVPADYDGDGDTDIAYFRPSTGRWNVLGQAPVAFGASGDIPVPGDYDGDGDADIAYYRPSTGRWYVLGQSSVAFGTTGAIPVPRDYDGNGDTDLAYFLPSNNRWYVLGKPSVAYGAPGAIPVPADYDGDGDADLAHFLPSNNRWYVLGQPSVAYGVSGAIPVPSDYDGDGDTDIAYFRPSPGRWYVLGKPSVAYGTVGDFPLPVRDTNGDGDPYQ